MASAVAPPTTPATTTSTDPLYTAAVAQAKDALAGETAPITSEQNASDAQFSSRETDATNVAAALSKLLQPIGPAVNSMYQAAGQNKELAANGFSQGMQDALKGNTDNLNAMLAKLGQPTQLDSHASQAGDVLYGLGGYNPGVSFSKAGAAFGSAAELQSGDAILRGQENVKSLQAQALVADQGFQNKIAEMAGKLPGDIQTNYQHLQTIALNDAKFREQVNKDNTDAAYKTSEIKLAQLKYSTGVQEFNAKQTLAYTKLANTEFNQNRNYALSLQKVGIANAKLQLQITQNSYMAANGGLKPAQVAKFASEAQSIAMKSYYGTTKVTSSSGKLTETTGVGKVTYSEALQNILAKGTPVQIALDALDRIYPAAERPTPAILAQVLGPLDPSALAVVAKGMGTTPGINNPNQSLISPQTQPYKDYAFGQFGKYGWNAVDAQSLDSLWNRESGWSPTASNPGSGASGIPQELGHAVPADYATNPQAQIDWGLNYIKTSYGSPTRAWQFWQATQQKNAAIAPADLRAKAQQWISKGYVGY